MPPRALRAPILNARLPPVGHPDARVEQTSAHPFARALVGLARARCAPMFGWGGIQQTLKTPSGLPFPTNTPRKEKEKGSLRGARYLPKLCFVSEPIDSI